MAAKRFKQVDQTGVNGAPTAPGHMVSPVCSGAPAAHGRQAVAEGAATRAASGAVARGSRFADAAGASVTHRFPKLGGSDLYAPAAGQVPVAHAVSDVAGSAYATDDAPRPIGAEAALTGSFKTIGAAQGAVLPTRETASQAAEAARGVLPSSADLRASTRHRTAPRGGSGASLGLVVGVVLAAVAALALVVVLVGVVAGVGSSPATGGAQSQAAQSGEVAPGEGIAFGDYTYAVAQPQEGGAWALTRSSASETVVISELAGTPVSLLLSDGVFFVVENLPDGTWDIITYMAADGAVASQLLDASGNPLVGQGEIQSASLEDGVLALVDGTGARKSVTIG